MDNFGKILHQVMQNDPHYIMKGYKKKFENDSSVYPLFPRFPNTRNIQRYVERLIAFHTELAEEEIKIQERYRLITEKEYTDFLKNMKSAPWAHEKISDLKIQAIGRYITQGPISGDIEYNTYIEPPRLTEPESYKKARESYQTVLNIIFT